MRPYGIHKQRTIVSGIRSPGTFVRVACVVADTLCGLQASEMAISGTNHGEAAGRRTRASRRLQVLRTLGRTHAGRVDTLVEEMSSDAHRVPDHRIDPDRDAPHYACADLSGAYTTRAPLLTAEQECELALRAEAGDPQAREALVNSNVRLVASIARRYVGHGMALEDLVQEGIVGLLRAIDKYDFRLGFRFSTYASHWIRQGISRALANKSRSIRLPAHVVDQLTRLARVRAELMQSLDRFPTRAELAAASGISEMRMAMLLSSALQPLSLDTPFGEDDDAHLGDFVATPDRDGPLTAILEQTLGQEIRLALQALTARERQVVELRFGLGVEHPLTLEETGQRLLITRERARQVEARALAKLRSGPCAMRLREVSA